MAWNESNRIYNHDQHSGPTVVFSGDATSGAPPHYAPGTWHTIDLKPLGVSADAKFAEINGFLIITDAGSEIDNLTATFRPPGSTLNEGNYQMQAISVWSGGGERQVQSVTVALVNGCFEFYWQKTVGGVPENGHPSAFLLNLWLAKWGKFVAESGGDYSAQIAALQADIAALSSAVGGLTDQSSAIADLQTRVAALESSPPPSTPTIITVPAEGMTIQFVQQAA